MAAKATILVAALVTMVFCRVDSVSRWGETGGYAVDDHHYYVPYTTDPPPPVNSASSTTTPRAASDTQTKVIETKEIMHECCQCSHTNSGSSSSSGQQKSDSSSSGQNESGLGVVGDACVCIFLSLLAAYGAKLLLDQDSVLLVQVAFDRDTDKIQQGLNRIVTESLSRRGLHSLLSNIVSCVYRYPESCVAAYSHVQKTGKYIGSGWEKCFDQTYSELRRAVNPFVCVNDCGRGTECEEHADHSKYLVVSILVAASGKHWLPAIKSYSDLDRVLYSLPFIKSQDIKAVKLLWATRHNIEDFPYLKRLRD